MVTYEAVDGTTNEVITKIMEAHHQGLIDGKVKWDAQFWVGEDEAPAIKISGYASFGKVIVFTPDKRKGGSKDFRICLDRAEWEQASTDDRDAMVDELLQSIEVRMTSGSDTKASEIIYDSAGRPKLKRRKYDLRLLGFSEVCKRHGYHSVEYRTVQAMKMQWNQLLLFQEPAGSNGNGATVNDGQAERTGVEIIDKDIAKRNKRGGKKKGAGAGAVAMHA